MQPEYPQPNPVMQQPAPAPTPAAKGKKPWIIAGLALVGVLVVAALFVLWWMNAQGKQYSAAATKYEQKVEDTFKAISGQPEDTVAYIKFLGKHESALGKTLATEPKQPQLLWIKAAPADAAKRVEELSKATQDLQNAMRNYRLFLIYRDGVLEAVRGSGGTISTVDQLRETKSRLEAAQKSIKNLTPPPGLKDNQQKYAGLYDKPIATMQAALAAYDTGNTTKYTEEITKLAEEVKAISLPKTASELLGMHQYYDAMNKAYDALDKLVG